MFIECICLPSPRPCAENCDAALGLCGESVGLRKESRLCTALILDILHAQVWNVCVLRQGVVAFLHPCNSCCAFACPLNCIRKQWLSLVRKQPLPVLHNDKHSQIQIM